MLGGKVAVVTGASRGVGKGIALALGEAGATVYVTGRSEAGGSTEGLPGTVVETADAVTQRGGRGIAARCDHTNDAEVEALFARVGQEQGRLDLLVNNVWGGYEQFDFSRFGAPFWEQPLGHWSGMFEAGVRAHLAASRLAAPLMISEGRGLIVHTTAWERDKYLGNLFYDVAKAAVNRMALGMGASCSRTASRSSRWRRGSWAPNACGRRSPRRAGRRSWNRPSTSGGRWSRWPATRT